MLAAVGRARQLAIANHTTVYMVFVPTNFWNLPYLYGGTIQSSLYPNGINTIPSATDRRIALVALTNLVDKQLTGYNFISLGQVGDQPGRHDWHYLGDWQFLPNGAFIASEKFLLPVPLARFGISQWQSDYAGKIDNWRGAGGTPQMQIYSFTNAWVPFPTEQSPQVLLPCIAFNSFGRLVSEYDGGNPDSPGSYHHAYIPLAQGAVGYGRDVNKQPVPTLVTPQDIRENPPGNATNISYNVIDIDALTGRAVLEYHKVQ
jgi:hypothetical protein